MLTLKDLMTPAPVTIGPDATLRDAVELITKVGVNALPVTKGDVIVGVLTAQSIIAFESTTPGVPTKRDPSTSGSGNRRRMKTLLVVEGGKLCGIVTTMDITRAFAQQTPTDVE